MKTAGTHYLYASNLFVSTRPYHVNTILGSCVAVCIWDQKLQFGGINHFMLPWWNGQGLSSPKFGNIAIYKLVEKMEALGCSKKNLQAKIFGGGEILEFGHDHFHIGERNIETAYELLKEIGIPITGQSVGGKLGRKIQFSTDTGNVKMKYINKPGVKTSD
ncbi:MAG: chemotaxis protein CheD [Cyclobacteriaceae bacterium]|nr:chemotaxis protein CheD [Cyclobacteriaceae bacterium]